MTHMRSRFEPVRSQRFPPEPEPSGPVVRLIARGWIFKRACRWHCKNHMILFQHRLLSFVPNGFSEYVIRLAIPMTKSSGTNPK